VDEYGYTTILCRHCESTLTFDEVIAYCIPLDRNQKEDFRTKIADLDFDNVDCICLGCYADIVMKRSKRSNFSRLGH
jgi:hypothetical protein